MNECSFRGRRAAVLAAAIIAAPLLGAPPDEELTPGVTVRVYQLAGNAEKLPRVADGQTPNADWVLATVDLPDAAAFGTIEAPFVTHVLGWLDLAAAGEHEFRLISDDGSKLWIDGALVVDHDGQHGATAKAGAPIKLETGRRELRIEHFDSGGKRALRLEWKPPGAAGFVLVPAAQLRTFADNARVTSPGVKRLHFDTRAGDQREPEGVHPAFAHSVVLPESLKDFAPQIGAMCFLPDGRLVVGTFNPLQRSETALPDIQSKVPDKLYAISGVEHHNPARVRVEVIADGLFEPCGLCAVGDVLYVSHRCAITELRDLDRDGVFETRRDIARGWECWNYHQFTFGLLHRDGKLYAALSTAMAPPGWEGMGTNAAPNGPMRGGVIEVDIASGSVSVIAGGTRTPNGIGWGPDGSIFYSDNQGVWMPTSQVAEIVPGRFYGHYNNTNIVPKLAEWLTGAGLASALCDRPRAPAAIYLAQNELANSPSQQIMVERGPYAGQMLVGEITAGGIRRVFLERVNGEWQGAAFRFTQGLSCGINRLAWGPDGALYAGGIGASGNWGWENTRAGLDRLAPTGITPFEMLAVRAVHDGFEIEFTKPADAAFNADPAHFTVRQWRYEPTFKYGGEKIDERTLAVSAARASGDSRRVRLTIPGLRPDEGGSVVYIRTDPRSADGEEMWSTEAWYTLNNLPRREAPQPARLVERAIDPRGLAMGVGAPPPADASVLIGRTAGNACVLVPRRNERPTEGRTQKEIISAPGYVEVGNGSGDLISRNSFADCRLHVEWYCPPGGEGQMAGNSGVYIHERYEVQVLGTLAGERALEMNEAGAIYGVRAAAVNASTGPGTWQAYDIWFRSPRFVNGRKSDNARMTVYWNGVLIHDNVEVPTPTGAAAAGGEKAHGAPHNDRQIGAVRFQDHASHAEGAVRYRNVWIAPLETPRAIDGPWRDLLDGRTLDGWSICGGAAEFAVQDGAIVGATRPNTSNTFLVTREQFDDFELLLEFKVHPELNSGVQVRSTVDGGVEDRAGGVAGYQVEIDPSERAYTGGIYEEARRGWLYPLVDNPAARTALKQKDWNSMRVLAEGPRIRTWINGVPASDVHDAFALSGHIALQVHGVGDRADPLEARFRNIRVRTPAR